MVIVNLIGGLGNQMFQYACGRACSIRTGERMLLATDTFKNYKLHNGFELERVFNIECEVARESDIFSTLGWQGATKLRKVLAKPGMRLIRNGRWVCEPHFEFWPKVLEIKGDAYIHGYWQSERYFLDAENVIRHDFNFKNRIDDADQEIIDLMRQYPSASLHVRRGDYANSKNAKIYALCGVDYYDRAINILRSRVPGIRFFVFSDDFDWVESNLCTKYSFLTLVKHNAGARSSNDLRLMSYADHHVIANSSFSWWGAWLNPSPDKLVVAPERWFVSGIRDVDLIPSKWIRV